MFRIFSATDRAQELSLPTSGNLMQQTLVAASNTTVSGSFPLIATIPAGKASFRLAAISNTTWTYVSPGTAPARRKR
jgi:hypothetical protein